MTTNTDFSRAWHVGYTAGWEAGQARLSWQFEDRERRGPVPQQPPCPYAVATDVNLRANCETAAQMFEQHKGR